MHSNPLVDPGFQVVDGDVSSCEKGRQGLRVQLRPSRQGVEEVLLAPGGRLLSNLCLRCSALPGSESDRLLRGQKPRLIARYGIIRISMSPGRISSAEKTASTLHFIRERR